MILQLELLLHLCFIIVLISISPSLSLDLELGNGDDGFERDDFPAPPDFVFGASASAYQVEGAADQDGRTPSIWDTYAHEGKMDGATGDVACDQYHKYKEDVQLMVKTGLEAYRFSISWSRLIPNGRGPVNPKGLQYYNNLIDQLISNGIQPHVTLHHADLPQALEDEYGGWVSPNIVKDFTAYANVCFEQFGDRVAHWTTMNEPNVFVLGGYDIGFLPPQHCSAPFGVNCSRGNSSTEPYLAIHNILLSHASAAALYKQTYQHKQRGFIGINVFSYWFIPRTETQHDQVATQRAMDFYFGWVVHPLVYGDYPRVMKKNAGSRIPTFTSAESAQVQGSFDFIGLNYYVTLYAEDFSAALNIQERDYTADSAIQIYPLDFNQSTFEYPITPWGMEELLEYIKQNYGNPPLYIHENGQRTRRNSSLEDWSRIEYMHGHIHSLLNVIRNGSNARGYFMWSLLDSIELLDGLKSSYGLYYIDLDDPELKRQPKLSAHWYSKFLKKKNFTPHSASDADHQRYFSR
ncbi:beta-glucosidase 11-like [Argentina anserina]|uniref:beta-glucosidase 11-like n=1 Tax=Argentina anserina TaxID=57926 RepID=UPI0021766842|nr:beta-glucosidase 11-like [Potentilla anserina]